MTLQFFLLVCAGIGIGGLIAMFADGDPWWHKALMATGVVMTLGAALSN